MQNNTPYYKAQNDPFGGFVSLPFQCSCSHVFSSSFGDSGILSTFMSDSNVSTYVCGCACVCACVCMRAMRIWVPTFSVCAVRVYLYSRLGPFEMSPSNFRSTEVWRITKDRKDAYKREILCCRHRSPWCECSWLEDTDKLSVMCAGPLPSLPLIAIQSSSDFKKGIYLDTYPLAALSDFPDERLKLCPQHSGYYFWMCCL